MSPSRISDPCGTVAGMVTPKGSMSTEGETLQVSVLPYRCSKCWLLRAPDKRFSTRSTVSADGPGRPLHFAAHRQPLCWNFMYHSRIVLSIGGSVRYMVRNLCCTITIDSVLANSKTQNAFLFTVHAIFRHDYPLVVKLASKPRHLVQKNFERFSTYWYAPFCRVCLGCCAVEFGGSGGTYE